VVYILLTRPCANERKTYGATVSKRHLRKAKRKRSPDVWEFLWRESGLDGKQRQRTLTVGNVQELRTEREALNHIQMLRTNINRDVTFSPLMTFETLVNRYRETERLADNKTEKTRTTYLAYLRRWIFRGGDMSTCTVLRLQK